MAVWEWAKTSWQVTDIISIVSTWPPPDYTWSPRRQAGEDDWLRALSDMSAQELEVFDVYRWESDDQGRNVKFTLRRAVK